MDTNEYGVAQLSEETLGKLKHIENELRQETHEEIVLIAYKKDEETQ
ncbi:hypothetical protein LCM10_13570 [Rossellomorea aquimaris]|nr:hypothetical protein [Rossellomorea aquimaris]MCA1056022.1 hypothetical protein [Rossellomorea aquimaris]